MDRKRMGRFSATIHAPSGVGALDVVALLLLLFLVWLAAMQLFPKYRSRALPSAPASQPPSPAPG